MLPADETPHEPVPPVLGRASPASTQPATLRVAAGAASAAYRADGGDGPGWAVRAATVSGVRHRLAGLGPEDAYAWRQPPGAPGTVVAAVADGVGGVEGSAAAAAAAVDAACDAMAAGITPGAGDGEEAWRAAFAAAGEAVRVAGGATTLVLAVVHAPTLGGHGHGHGHGANDGGGAGGGNGAGGAGGADGAGGAGGGDGAGGGGAGDGAGGGGAGGGGGDGGGGGGERSALRVGAVGRIGDSTAMVLRDGAWSELWPPTPADDGPISTATAALSGRTRPAGPDVVAVTLGADDALVLLTDGVANPWRDGPTTVAPALGAALAAPPGPLGLAVLTDFSRQGCFDDRTIVGLWPRAQPGPADGPAD